MHIFCQVVDRDLLVYIFLHIQQGLLHKAGLSLLIVCMAFQLTVGIKQIHHMIQQAFQLQMLARQLTAHETGDLLHAAADWLINGIPLSDMVRKQQAGCTADFVRRDAKRFKIYLEYPQVARPISLQHM